MKHALRLTILCALVLISLSCVKRPENFNPAEEIPIDYNAYTNSITQAYGTAALSDLKTGAFHNSVRTLQITGYNERVLDQKGQTILCYNSKDQNYKIIEQSVRYDSQGNAEKSSVEHNYPSAKSNLYTSVSLMFGLLSICDPKEPINQQTNTICSELEIETKTVAPPPAVQQKPDCGGLPNCQMTVKTISFYRSSDFIDVTGNKIRNKMQISLKISQQAPLLSRFLEFCQHGIHDIDPKTQIYAKICEKTMNFDKGQSNQTLCPTNTDQGETPPDESSSEI